MTQDNRDRVPFDPTERGLKLLDEASITASELISEIRADLARNSEAHKVFMREIEKLRKAA